MQFARLATVALVLAFVVSCGEDPQAPPPPPPEYTYQVVEAFPNLEFTQPVDLQDPGDGTNRLFVVEQAGIIHVFENSPTASSTELFLDITGRVESSNIEEGLLSIAFDPQFSSNGHFYVYYTYSLPLDGSRISRFRVTPPDGNSADPGSEVIILSTTQPADGHNGGQMAFDAMGYLYFGFGDGESPGDPNDNAQDLTNLKGSVIRIDVSTLPYKIPDDNPYKGNTMGYKEEIFAHGFRNPWRLTIDPVMGDIWVGDVGQARYEEINVVKMGKNYGWDCREGFHEYDLQPDPGSPSPLCASISEFEDPVIEYVRDVGTTVIGGYVYRGSKLSTLVGKYIYSDNSATKVWSLEYDGQTGTTTTLVDSTGFNFSSLAIDTKGELYLLDHDWNKAPTQIYKLIYARTQ